MSNRLEAAKPEFTKVLERLDKELRNLRTGRANAALVEDVKVEAYDSMMDLKGLAAVSVPDAKTIQIEPWDKGLVKDVEKALIAANLGLTPNVSGSIIRLNMPQMNEETRRETVKTVKQKGEQAKIAIRNVREAAREGILNDEKANLIGEDERFRLMEQLDKAIKEVNDKVDETVNDKEEEIMTI